DCPGRMAGEQTQSDCSAAERDLHAVGSDNVTLRLSLRKTVDGFVDQIPIARAHDDTGAIAFLHELRAADFVQVSVGNDDVFHPGRLEPRFFQSGDSEISRI